MPLVSKTFADIITFTRASTSTYFNSAGVLTSSAIDTPRFDYNPSTLAAQGLLIEEARTNSIRNNTMVGAVAGTPGTICTNWFITAAGGNLTTVTIVGTGTESGITYIDIRFIASGATIPLIQYETNTQIVAAAAQTWTDATYVRLIAGSLTNVTVKQRVEYRTSAGASVNLQDLTIIPTSAGLATQRYTNSFVAVGGTIAAVTSGILPNFTGAGDITLRIGLPQLELGAFATSVIPTSTVALTRAADVASVNTLSPWYNASEGTLYAEFSHFFSAATLFPRIASLDDTTANNAIRLGVSGVTAYSYAVVVGGVLQASLVASTVSNNTTVRSAGAYKVNEFPMAANGLLGILDTSGTLPTVSQLTLGSSAAANWLNGYLRRITYYPRRLSDAELISLTA